jgi:hypothetical protein
VDAIRQAHHQEILEAMMSAAASADAPTFFTFYDEWKRIDTGETRIRFAGMPRPYIANGFCFHCGENWTINGVSFDDMDPVGEADCVELHVVHGSCPQRERCHCFMAHDAAVAQCQLCLHPFETCLCGDPSPGPCLEPLVTMRWLS